MRREGENTKQTKIRMGDRGWGMGDGGDGLMDSFHLLALLYLHHNPYPPFLFSFVSYSPLSFPMRRIVIIGTTGSGKTTLAVNMARLTGIPHIELDALHWNPDWVETPTESFLEKVETATNTPAWIADGNYSKARSILWQRADTLFWLDYPFHVILRRLTSRTLRHLVLRESCCNGNHETLGKVFSSDSIILWALRSHWRHCHEYERAMTEPRYSHLRKIRFRSPSETHEWLEQTKRQWFIQ